MRGSVKSRSRKSWQIRYYGPPDPKGKRKQINETIRGTKPEAERVLRERITAVETGNFVPKHNETVSEFLQRWLDTYARTNTRLRTQQGYRGNISRYIVPVIGRLTLQALTGRQIDAMYASMVKRGLSAQTVLHVHRILKQALGHGVRWGLVARNVADAATSRGQENGDVGSWHVKHWPLYYEPVCLAVNLYHAVFEA